MSANTKLCDGECGNIYYEIDLNEACSQMLCNDCMFALMGGDKCEPSGI